MKDVSKDVGQDTGMTENNLSAEEMSAEEAHDLEQALKGLGLSDDLPEVALVAGPRPDREAAARIKARTLGMVRAERAAKVAGVKARAAGAKAGVAGAGGGAGGDRRNRIWWVGTVVVAAGLLAFIILGALGRVPGLPFAPTSHGGSTPLSGTKLDGVVRTIQMIDAQTAWATGAGVAYRTVDGGNSWTEFRFHSADANARWMASTALDRDHLWVVEEDTQGNSGAIWSTKDGGSTWTHANLVLGSNWAATVNLDFTSATDGWLLVSSDAAAGQMSKAIYHSEDGGQSWVLVASGFPGSGTTPPALSAGGGSWLTGGMYTTGMAFQNNVSGWVTGSYHGNDLIPVYRTNDGGKSWTLQNLDIPANLKTPNTHGNGISPIFFGPKRLDGVLPVGLRSGDSYSVAVFQTKDGGRTWSFGGAVEAPELSSGSAVDGRLLGVDSQHLWIVAHGGVLYRTQDGGKTWSKTSAGQDLAGVSFGSATTGLGLSSARELVKSTDGGATWVPLGAQVSGPSDSTSPSSTAQLSLSVIRMMDPTDGWGIQWTQTAGYLYRTADGGRTWTKVSLPSGDQLPAGGFSFNPVAGPAGPGNELWAGTSKQGTSDVILYHTTDGGATWQTTTVATGYTNGIPVHPGAVSFVDAVHGWLMVSPEHGMNSEPGELLATNDGGKTWTEVTHDGPNPGDMPFGGSILFTSTTDGWLVGSQTSTTQDYLYRTTDGGKTWNKVDLPVPASIPGGWVNRIELPKVFGTAGTGKETVLPVNFGKPNAGVIFGGAYVSDDGGSSWRFAGGLIPDFVVPTFLTARDGFAATSKGLFATSDGGATWNLVNSPKLAELTAGNFSLASTTFVTPKVGWILLQLSNQTSQLLETQDGGQTWAVVPAAAR